MEENAGNVFFCNQIIYENTSLVSNKNGRVKNLIK